MMPGCEVGAHAFKIISGSWYVFRNIISNEDDGNIRESNRSGWI
jgi:hypothetical protein